ncbi:MAG: pilus assembly protein PilM [Candidatus Omnitrophica bacterium]|nr:pilus assembly protein PilM [Candidatus Omnitrophota bacterium]
MSKKIKTRKLSIGIDIGENSIKVVQLACTPKGNNILAHAQLPVPSYANASEKLLFIKDALKKIFKENKFKKSTVSMLVPASESCVRIFTIPSMPDSEIPEAVKWTSKRYIAHPIEEMVLGYVQEQQVIEQNVKKIKISFLGVHKNIYQTYVDYASSLGFKTFSVNTSCHAIKNFVSANNNFINKAVMVLNIGLSSTDIVILYKGQLVFTRNIPEGGRGFDEAIIDNLSLGEGTTQVSSSIARDIKQNFGILLEDTNQIYNGVNVWDATQAMHNHVDRIVREIQLSLSHYRQLSHGGEIEEVLLTGGGAKIANLDRLLSEKISLPVNNPSRIKLPAFFNLDELDVYACSIGAALEKGDNPNLINNIQKIAKKKTTQGSKLLKRIIIVFVSLFLLLFFSVGGFYFIFQGRIQYYRRRLNGLQSKSMAIEELTTSVKALNLRKKIMSTISDSEPPVIEVIMDISQIVDPNRMIVDSMNFQTTPEEISTFNIKGKILSSSEADSMDIISDFLSGLEKTGHFSLLSPKITERGSRDKEYQDYINFEVSCTFKGRLVKTKDKTAPQWQNPMFNDGQNQF